MKEMYPVITLYQPWAQWIMDGYKTIETRLHDRFRCLKGKKILIHAGMTFDKTAENDRIYVRGTMRYVFSPGKKIPQGAILGFAYVKEFRELRGWDSEYACIDCKNTRRFGLYLTDIEPLDFPIPAKGSMGIWYFNMDKMEKVRKG